MKKQMAVLVWMIAILLWLAACGSTGQESAPETDEPVGLPNSASVHCEEQGGRLEMRTDEDGTVGVCIFDDGSECEEWAYFRGECAPGSAVDGPVLVPDGAMARDAALDHLRALGLVVPAGDADWSEEDTTTAGLVGGSRLAYSADGWTVDVSFPVVAPEATIYTVKVSNTSSGYGWQGKVDATGLVSESNDPSDQESGQPDIGLANPAAVHCEEQGGRLESRTEKDGAYGVCIFDDGSECEEWAYWRSECGPASNAERMNVTLEAGLANAIRLELLELDPAAESSQPYRLVLTIEADLQLSDIVRALNTATPRTPKTLCVPTYLLRFHQANGTQQELGYMCDAAQATLSGEQGFWQNQEAAAPALFVALLDNHLGRAQDLPAPGQSLNPVANAHLAETKRIEVLVQTHSEKDGIGEATIQPLAEISDLATIDEIVAVLDAELPLGPRARCLANVVLVFHRADGSTTHMGYGCKLESAIFLRGDDEHWNGQDAIAPPALHKLILRAVEMNPVLPAAEGTATRAVAWYGYVISGDRGDRLVLFPEGAGELALVGDEDEHEAQIAELRDRSEPGRNAHYWGTVNCDNGACTLVADRIRVDGPGSFFPPEPVQGWQGKLITMRTEPGSGPDDAFVLAGDWPLHYGVWSVDAELDAQLESLRDSGKSFRIWGELTAGVPDANATQIVVTRVELLD